MYLSYFGLQHDPFSIAPDPHYLFMSERHREALAHLLYGLDSGGGFVLLSGEIGTGKTTICRCFLEQIPANCRVAYIFNPKLTVLELLQTIGDEFHIQRPRQGQQDESIKDCVDPLNAFLLQAHAQGQNSVLIIDEAQNLGADVLEQLRLLTNLETAQRKLLQIILIGQPELRAMLARPELEQLSQRVIARYHLNALNAAETTQYIAHRLAVAGLDRALPFDAPALKLIHRHSRGVPRRINLLCDRALLGAWASGHAIVNRAVVTKAAHEVFEPPVGVSAAAQPASWAGRLGASLPAIALTAVLTAVGMRMATQSQSAAPSPAATTPGATAAPAKPAASGLSVQAASPTLPAPLGSSAFQALVGRLPAQADPLWRTLARRWDVHDLDETPCAALQRQHIRCYQGPVSLALVRQWDRPGMLTVFDQQRRPRYAILSALTADTATLETPDGTVQVTLSALASVWRGEFATLWRAHPAYKGAIKDAEQGPAVDWLAHQLALQGGQPAPAPHQSMDSGLRRQVFAFQLAQGLKADGQVGAATLMQLNRALGLREPRLSIPADASQ